MHGRWGALTGDGVEHDLRELPRVREVDERAGMHWAHARGLDDGCWIRIGVLWGGFGRCVVGFCVGGGL